MSRGARRAHGLSRGVRRLIHRVLRVAWQCLRVLCVIFAAMGPGMPPPPPPPRPVAMASERSGEKLEEP